MHRSLVHAVVMLGSCYQGDDPVTEPPSPYSDADHNGIPDVVEGDPSLDDNDRDPSNNPPGDFDGDGLADDSDVDDDNDWILDEVAPADLVAAVQPIARAECEAVASCCAGGWSSTALDRCALQSTGRMAVALAQSWVDGWVTVEPSGLDACLAAQSFSCDLPPRVRRMPHDCRAYLVGHRTERSGCNRTPDCQDSSFCTGDTDPGDVPSEIGPGPYDLDFWIGSHWAQERICLPYSLASETCEPVGRVFCAAGLKCLESDEGSWCVEPVYEGGECQVVGTVERADDCAEGLACDDEQEACVSLVSGGQPCVENRDCRSRSCDPRTQLCAEPLPPFDYCGEGARYAE
jgi:hypothetical protein